MQQDLLQTLRWVRTFGDVVFIVGALAVAWQVVIGLLNKSANVDAIVKKSGAVGIVDPAANTATEKSDQCCGHCGGGN
jgi:nitric oxide reductase subunit B